MCVCLCVFVCVCVSVCVCAPKTFPFPPSHHFAAAASERVGSGVDFSGSKLRFRLQTERQKERQTERWTDRQTHVISVSWRRNGFKRSSLLATPSIRGLFCATFVNKTFCYHQNCIPKSQSSREICFALLQHLLILLMC